MICNIADITQLRNAQLLEIGSYYANAVVFSFSFSIPESNTQ